MIIIREILFKAKRKNRKELPNEQWWVEGYYAELGIGENKKYYIIQNGALPQLFKNQDQNMYFIDVEVEPSTLCRYTGLTDKKDKKIFEHHILKDRNGRLHEVIYDESFGAFIFKDGEVLGLYRIYEMEIIGNVFDNPELLEQET